MTCAAPTRVAIVDDDADVRIALGRLVASSGFDVETYGSAAAFLEAVRRRDPDCVLLDLQMPLASGFDVQQALAASGRASIPVVVITGHDSPESRARALALGAATYLRKPVDGTELMAAIRLAIAGGPRSGIGDSGDPPGAEGRRSGGTGK